MTKEAKKVMVVVQKGPHGSIYAQEAVEVMFILATYDMDLSVVFVEDGVFALKKGQDTRELGMKGFLPSIAALADWEVTRVYVDGQSLTDRNLSEESLTHIGEDEETGQPLKPRVLSNSDLAALMREQDVIMSF